ncbi:ABC transporter permease [Clostridium malenominatum]|uniref:ABC transporter permease n=1 Tax=Clostridium malenominatum TaxID=1539 RepID=UPI0031D4B42E
MKKFNRLIFNLITYIFVFLLSFPLVNLIIWMFAKRWEWPYLFPNEFSLRGLKYFIGSSDSVQLLLYSIWLSLVVTIVTVIISIPASKALGVYNFKGKKIFEFFIISPLLVPTVSVAMGIHIVFIKLGIANTFLGVVLVHLIPCIPYGVRILTDVFAIVGESMEIQARVLGASSIKAFFYVTLPMIMPGILSAASMVFIVSFSQYFLTFLIGGGRVITFAMAMFPFIESGDRMMASLYSIVFILTSLLFLVLIERLVKSYYKLENNYFV